MHENRRVEPPPFRYETVPLRSHKLPAVALQCSSNPLVGLILTVSGRCNISRNHCSRVSLGCSRLCHSTFAIPPSPAQTVTLIEDTDVSRLVEHTNQGLVR